MITEANIKSTIRNVETKSVRWAEIKDENERGAGRLCLIARHAKKGATAEWYAVWHRSGKRKRTKIGSYPNTTLTDARKRFREEFCPVILQGRDPIGPRRPQTKHGITVKDLFEAYVSDLERRGASSARTVRYALLGPKNQGGVAAEIGAGLLASDIKPSDISPVLKTIYDRGAQTHARAIRSYIRTAYKFGMNSRHSYVTENGEVDWGIKANPVDAIPSDRESARVGNRHLNPAEFRALWRWLETQDERFAAAPAIRLILATGQRVSEVTSLRVEQFDPAQTTLDWPKTKNSLPHMIPLTRQATQILSAQVPSREGFFFPATARAIHPVKLDAVGRLIQTYVKETGVIAFTPRDFRRTWRTLSGQAGLSHEIRGRLQNHSPRDIGTRHYDRYRYLSEKRAAVSTWADFLDRILCGAIDNDTGILRA